MNQDEAETIKHEVIRNICATSTKTYFTHYDDEIEVIRRYSDRFEITETTPEGWIYVVLK